MASYWGVSWSPGRYTSLHNYLFYQAGWFACVLGGASHRPWAGFLFATALVGAHLTWSHDRAREVRRVAVAVVVGTAVEAIQIGAGTYQFASGTVFAALPPPWLIAVWAQLATTFGFSLRTIVHRPVAAALFGAVGGPIAYVAGERFGAVTLQRPLTPGLILLSINWVAAMLVFSVVERRLSRNRDASPTAGHPPRPPTGAAPDIAPGTSFALGETA